MPRGCLPSQRTEYRINRPRTLRVAHTREQRIAALNSSQGHLFKTPSWARVDTDCRFAMPGQTGKLNRRYGVGSSLNISTTGRDGTVGPIRTVRRSVVFTSHSKVLDKSGVWS